MACLLNQDVGSWAQCSVRGVPVKLVFSEDKLIGRLYGEMTSEKFEAILKNYFKFKGDYREGPEE